MEGTVKFFNENKGWGFIKPDGGGEELFVHFSSIQTEGFKSLLPDQRVEFDEGQNDKGRCATNVRIIDE